MDVREGCLEGRKLELKDKCVVISRIRRGEGMFDRGRESVNV